MAFIKMPLGDAVPREVVPMGEYLVRCDAADIKPSTNPEKQGQQNVLVRCSVVDQPNAKTIFHILPGLHKSDDKDKRNNKMNMNIGFFEAFNIPYDKDGFDNSDIPGAEATVRLKIETDDDGTEYNRIVIKS